jgi:CDP-4-dehydro-6-deoxyglucose reductase, E3
MPPPPTFEARLVRARSLSPSVRELTFERTDGQPMSFEPGQWVNTLLPIARDGGPYDSASSLKRSYSIASAPDGSPHFDIAVTRVQDGPGSTWLHAVELGSALAFSGPQGFFTRPSVGGPPSLMVATGTGLTPMRSMVRAALASSSAPSSPSPSRAPLRILLGVRREEDMLYADEFEALARAHPWVHFEATLSQPGGSWQGRRGYVQTHVRELWNALAAASEETPHVYVCGLERMVGSVRNLLRKEMSLPREQVHSERYD